jgi:hypothetical protein
MFSVHLLDANGNGSYLKVKNKTQWKTKAIAKKHCADIMTLINKGKNIFNAVDCWVENEFGEIVK